MNIPSDIELLSLYQSTRNVEYSSIALRARSIIYKNIAYDPTLVGSYAVGIDIPKSDIDFAIGLSTIEEKTQIKDKLIPLMEFRGERPASLNTTRFLFCIKIDGVHIDLNVMDEKDFLHLVEGNRRAAGEIPLIEKAKCVYHKIRLKNGERQNFESYKTQIYKKYCPDLLWLPDHEIREMIEIKCRQENTLLPQWLIEKKQNVKT